MEPLGYPRRLDLEEWQAYLLSSEFVKIKDIIQKAIISWFKVNGRDLPWRKTRDPFAILVSEAMLQQTQVDRVIEFFHRFLKILPNFEAVAAASDEKLRELWEGLGYYNRVKNLKKTAKIIQEKYHGKFPTAKEEILALPGIGEYTAGAVMSFALGLRAPIVDTNVDRVFRRIFLPPDSIKKSSTAEKILWLLSETVLPEREFWEFNQGIMDFGALICIVGHPRCHNCGIRPYCRHYQNRSLNRFFQNYQKT